MAAGIPILKIDALRLLQQNGWKLTGSNHLASHIPFIRDQIVRELKDVLSKDGRCECFSIAFDGTARLGEAVVIVVRFVTDNISIIQRGHDGCSLCQRQ